MQHIVAYRANCCILSVENYGFNGYNKRCGKKKQDAKER